MTNHQGISVDCRRGIFFWHASFVICFSCVVTLVLLPIMKRGCTIALFLLSWGKNNASADSLHRESRSDDLHHRQSDKAHTRSAYPCKWYNIYHCETRSDPWRSSTGATHPVPWQKIHCRTHVFQSVQYHGRTVPYWFSCSIASILLQDNNCSSRILLNSPKVLKPCRVSYDKRSEEFLSIMREERGSWRVGKKRIVLNSTTPKIQYRLIL